MKRSFSSPNIAQMLDNEDTSRALIGSISTVGRDVRSTPMHWNSEGKKLTAAVQCLSWRPPWVRAQAGADDDFEPFIDEAHRGDPSGTVARSWRHDNSSTVSPTRRRSPVLIIVGSVTLAPFR